MTILPCSILLFIFHDLSLDKLLADLFVHASLPGLPNSAGVYNFSQHNHSSVTRKLSVALTRLNLKHNSGCYPGIYDVTMRRDVNIPKFHFLKHGCQSSQIWKVSAFLPGLPGICKWILAPLTPRISCATNVVSCELIAAATAEIRVVQAGIQAQIPVITVNKPFQRWENLTKASPRWTKSPITRGELTAAMIT